MPGVPLDALAQVKRGLRSLFTRRKKKKQPTQQPEPTPSSNEPSTQTTTAAVAAPVEAPTTSKRSVTEGDDVPKNRDQPHPPPHPAAELTTTTAASLMPDPPPALQPASTSADLHGPQPSERQHHISEPLQIEEAKEIDLNPARDVKTGEGSIKYEPSDIHTEAPSTTRPKPGNETGMSATSGPMGDHMAEVWRDSDVGAKEGRPVELEGKVVKVAGGTEDEGEGGKF